MNIEKFLGLTEAHTLSSEEASSLNLALASASKDDIPENKLELVKDYLIIALNMNSVEPRIIENLEKLLFEIQG